MCKTKLYTCKRCGTPVADCGKAIKTISHAMANGEAP